MGALGGAALGATAQTGSEAMQGAKNLAQRWDFTRKLGQAYNMGKEGLSFASSTGKSEIGKQLQNIPNQATDKILAVDKQLGQAVGDSLQNATASGVKINIDPELKTATDELMGTFSQNPTLLQLIDPKSKALFSKIQTSGMGDITPVEARALKDTLFDLGNKMSGLSSDVASIARQKGFEVGAALDDSLKSQIPEYADAAQKFSNFRSSVPEVALQPNIPADKRTKMLGDLKNKDTDLYKGMQNVLGNSMLPGSAAIEGPRTGLDEMIANLNKLQQSNPEAVKGLGGTAEQVGQNWQDMADRMATLKQSQGFNPHEGAVKTLTGSLVGSGEGHAYGLANKAGGLSKMSDDLFGADNSKLSELAQGLKGNKLTSFYGEALEKALNNKSEPAKNAALFQLMQIPEVRGMLKPDMGTSDNGQQQQ